MSAGSYQHRHPKACEQPWFGSPATSSFENSPSAERHAGQASVATISRMRLTRGLARSPARATAAVESRDRSAPHCMHIFASSGDWALHKEQVCTIASAECLSRIVPDPVVLST